jgi:hypothetical protein
MLAFSLLRDICIKGQSVQPFMNAVVSPLAMGYLELYNSEVNHREFFGLRDFYRYLFVMSVYVLFNIVV